MPDPNPFISVEESLLIETQQIREQILNIIGKNDYINLMTKVVKKYFPKKFEDPHLREFENIGYDTPFEDSIVWHTCHKLILNAVSVKDDKIAVQANKMVMEFGSYALVLPYEEGAKILAALQFAETAKNAASYDRENLQIKPYTAKNIEFSIISYNEYLLAKARSLLLGGEN